MSTRHYILDEEHRPVDVSLFEWAKWFETADRRVAFDQTDLFVISTVFLGLNHQFGDGPPILFETMAFERTYPDSASTFSASASLDMARYSSWDDAVVGHQSMLRRLLKKEADAKATIK